MAVYLNAANLRHGGGVQVGASFIDELAGIVTDADLLARFPWLESETRIAASPEVVENIGHQAISHLDISERSATFDFGGCRSQSFDVSFTLFGPEYVPCRSRRRVVGFADVTSLFPKYLARVSTRARLRQLARRMASKESFRRADRIVVEAGHIGRALSARWGIPSELVSIVPNTYNAIFNDPSLWLPSPLEPTKGAIHALYVTRAYPHKNLAVLGEVAESIALEGEHVTFVLTLREDEWQSLPASTRAHSINVGPVTVPQLPHLYDSCDVAFFPSLFEAFSVTPLEAMVTGTPLVASDREFVREVAGDCAWYAEPTDPADLGDALLEAARTGQGDRTQRAKERAMSWPSARSRALAYLEVIGDELLLV